MRGQTLRSLRDEGEQAAGTVLAAVRLIWEARGMVVGLVDEKQPV